MGRDRSVRIVARYRLAVNTREVSTGLKDPVSDSYYRTSYDVSLKCERLLQAAVIATGICMELPSQQSVSAPRPVWGTAARTADVCTLYRMGDCGQHRRCLHRDSYGDCGQDSRSLNPDLSHGPPNEQSAIEIRYELWFNCITKKKKLASFDSRLQGNVPSKSILYQRHWEGAF